MHLAQDETDVVAWTRANVGSPSRPQPNDSGVRSAVCRLRFVSSSSAMRLQESYFVR